MSKKREVQAKVMENENGVTLPKHIQARKDVVYGLLELIGLEEYDAKRLAINVTNILLEKEAENQEDELIRNLRSAREEREQETIDLLDGSQRRLSKKELKRLKRADKKKKQALKSQALEGEENMGEDSEDENEIEQNEKGTTKEKRGAHLIPREKIEYPSILLKHSKLGKYLEMHEAGGEDGRKGRQGMRKLGFKLSDKETWTSFLKEMKKVKK